MRLPFIAMLLAVSTACDGASAPPANSAEKREQAIENRARALEADVENEVRAFEARLQNEADLLLNESSNQTGGEAAADPVNSTEP